MNNVVFLSSTYLVSRFLKERSNFVSFLLQWTHTHMHTHTYTHSYTYTHTHIHTYTHTHYTHTHTHTHIHAHTHTRLHTHIHTYKHTRTQSHIQTLSILYFFAIQSRQKKWKWEILKIIRSFVIVKLLAENITFISGFLQSFVALQFQKRQICISKCFQGLLICSIPIRGKKNYCYGVHYLGQIRKYLLKNILIDKYLKCLY